MIVPHPNLSAEPCPRCGSTSREEAGKADESIPAPKGRGSWTPKPFPLQIDSFLGTATGAIIAILDPSQADAVIVGEGDAPVVAVLLAAAKKKADVRMAVPKGRGR